MCTCSSEWFNPPATVCFDVKNDKLFGGTKKLKAQIIREASLVLKKDEKCIVDGKSTA